MAMTAAGAQTKKVTVQTLSTKEFCEKVYDINADALKYKGDKPAIVDFYADWCGPCRAIAPTLQELAEQYAGEIVIYKVNIDNSPELAHAFGIVAMVAMAPLITIQLLGFKSVLQRKIVEKIATRRILNSDDEQIIDFM